MLTVTVRHNEKFYYVDLTLGQARRHDNGALISCGLTVVPDWENGFHASTLRRWIKQGIAREINRDEWSHSGCQSSCVRRGATVCRW